MIQKLQINNLADDVVVITYDKIDESQTIESWSAALINSNVSVVLEDQNLKIMAFDKVAYLDSSATEIYINNESCDPSSLAEQFQQIIDKIFFTNP